MIIKGKSRAGPGSLASHLGNAEKNERVEMLESRGTVATDLRGALAEMDAVALGTRCAKPLYHAAISPEPPHRLSPEQRMEAVDALEQKLGMEGHARVVVMHEKFGREHIHVVWSRIDVENMRSVSDSHNYRKHEECSRDLERRFGHERVQGAHAERDGPDGKVARPYRTPSRAELRQEDRTGIRGKEVKAEVTEAFRASDGPEAFRAALAERGYQLALGDRRDFVIVDQAGGVHSLARRIDGVKAADLRAFMKPLDRDSVPTIEQSGAAAKMARAENDPKLEKAYGRGGDYVSQSRAAQKEHEARQAALDASNGRDDRRNRIDAGEVGRDAEAARRQRDQEVADTNQGRAQPAPPSDAPSPDIEISDAMQARLDRLHAAQGETSPSRDDPGRQNGAPGGGRTRSR